MSRKPGNLEALDPKFCIHPKFLEPAQQFARAVEVALHKGHFDEAKSLVDQAEEMYVNECTCVVNLEKEAWIAELERYGLDVRIINGLEEMDIFTIQGLLNARATYIESQPNFGRKSILMIRKSLRDAGYRWRR